MYCKYIIAAASLLMAMSVNCFAEEPAKDSTHLYSWYNYDDAALSNVKKQTDTSADKLKKQYEAIIAGQNARRGVVPPGVYAGYGYMLYRNGDKEHALEMLNKEMELYPESSVYISKFLERVKQ